MHGLCLLFDGSTSRLSAMPLTPHEVAVEMLKQPTGTFSAPISKVGAEAIPLSVQHDQVEDAQPFLGDIVTTGAGQVVTSEPQLCHGSLLRLGRAALSEHGWSLDPVARAEAALVTHRLTMSMDDEEVLIGNAIRSLMSDLLRAAQHRGLDPNDIWIRAMDDFEDEAGDELRPGIKSLLALSCGDDFDAQAAAAWLTREMEKLEALISTPNEAQQEGGSL
jgi:hypothetical protein